MKKLLHIFLFLVIVLGLAACHKPAEISFDPSLLYGKWQEGSVYERYYESLIERVLLNGDTVQVNGTTWDEADDVTEEDADILAYMMLKIKDIAAQLELENGYRVVINCGEDGLQTVQHLHLHILGKRKLSWPPG